MYLFTLQEIPGFHFGWPVNIPGELTLILPLTKVRDRPVLIFGLMQNVQESAG
jgi:hypothetical protein